MKSKSQFMAVPPLSSITVFCSSKLPNHVDESRSRQIAGALVASITVLWVSVSINVQPCISNGIDHRLERSKSHCQRFDNMTSSPYHMLKALEDVQIVLSSNETNMWEMMVAMVARVYVACILTWLLLNPQESNSSLRVLTFTGPHCRRSPHEV